jgi:acyl-CoA synthetase (AMP-forming)/AMP-acid ligase II
MRYACERRCRKSRHWLVDRAPGQGGTRWCGPGRRDRSLTYSQLAARVRRLANGLRTLGVAKGDRVAWLGPNHPAFLESLFAAGLLGAAVAPVNHRLDEAEISWVLEDIKPRALIQHCATGAAAVRGSGFRRVAVAGSLDGATDFEALIAGCPATPSRRRSGWTTCACFRTPLARQAGRKG